MDYFNIFSYLSPKPDENEEKIHVLEEQLKTAQSLDEWRQIAKRLDVLKGNEEWKEDPRSEYYDHNLIQHRLSALQEASAALAQDRSRLVWLLRSGLHRKLGGIGNPHLYAHVHVGTKRLIDEYVRTVCSSLRALLVDPTFPLRDKFDFFWETRQAFGRTALCLSGGATLGLYHLGVIKALFEQGLLPRVISGSSVGSIIASLVSTRTDEELPEMFKLQNFSFNAFDPQGSVMRKLNRLLKDGVLMDITKLQQLLKENIGDMTFREAFQRTSFRPFIRIVSLGAIGTQRILNITVNPNIPNANFQIPKLLNYLTAPDVFTGLIWSAASASCALAGIYDPVILMAKDPQGNIVPYFPGQLRWSDGSVIHDLPMNRLSEMFNVNHFIVSQVNPHVIPFIRSTRDPPEDSILNRLKKSLEAEIRHRISQAADLGILPRTMDFFMGVLSQTYSGDITIVPDFSLEDYKKLLSNPTPEWIQDAMARSERSTWAQLSMIENHLMIEQTLDKAVQQLRQELNSMQPDTALIVFNQKLERHM